MKTKLSKIITNILTGFIVLFAINVVLCVLNFGVYFALSNGNSMQPTHGALGIVLTNALPSEINNLEFGDIISFYKDGEILEKRIIGMPGDTVEVVNDIVYVNGVEIEETYVVYNNAHMNVAKVTLGYNEYFVLGDNRTVSYDSRYFGPIEKSDIIGKTVFAIKLAN